MLGNSYSKVTGLTPRDFNALRKALSYRIDYATAQYVPNPAAHVKFGIDKRGNFATGLLPRVKRFLASNRIQYNTVATSNRTAVQVAKRAFSQRSEITPYPYQQEALNVVSTRKRGILSIATGCGKSFLISMILERQKLRTLIIVPNLELKRQLTASLTSELDSMEGVTVDNIDSNRLTDASQYDCLIIDESHHTAAKTYHKLNKTAWNHIQYRYFLTATPFRNNSEETILFESIAGEVIYELPYVTAITAGYIVPVEAYYVDVDEKETDGETYAEVYRDLVVTNESRNLKIGVLLARLANANLSTLCLVKEIAHGKKLSELTGIHFAHGMDTESRAGIKDFSQGRINSLIGTTGLVGEGVDTKPCEWVVIAGLGKAKSAFLQQVGRAVRKYPGKESAKVIIFRDKSHRWTRKHFNLQKRILLDYYGVSVVRLDI